MLSDVAGQKAFIRLLALILRAGINHGREEDISQTLTYTRMEKGQIEQLCAKRPKEKNFLERADLVVSVAAKTRSGF